MKWRVDCDMCRDGVHSVRSGRCSNKYCDRNDGEEQMVNLAQDEGVERLRHLSVVRHHARDLIQVITGLARRAKPLSYDAASDVIARAKTMEHMLLVHLGEAVHV